MRLPHSLLVLLAALAVALLPAASASALPFPVTSTADTDAKGTLRGSIEEANARPGADSIPIEATGTIELGSALPPIENSLSIIGPGAAELTIEREAGAPPFGILTFAEDFPSIVREVTVSGGLREGTDPRGAGILNEGTERLTLIDVVVAENEARAEGGVAAVARGGGVASFGPLTVVGSTIAGNDAVAEDGGSQTEAAGGGIDALGPLTLERSTVSGNAVHAFNPGGDPAKAEGGGIWGVQLEIVGATIAGSESTSDGVALGANLGSPAPGLVRNTIVSDPRGEVGSCSGPLASGGFNLDEDGTCEFTDGSDLAFVDPLLAPLADNGGPTPTHALTAGTIAVDRGNSIGATVDQRGLPRPSDFATISDKEGGDGSDIGAFELQAPPSSGSPILVNAVPGDRIPPNTRIVKAPPRSGFERLARFRFNSTEGQSRFQCKVDGGRWRGCQSPYKRKVSAGRKPGRKHVFKVRAIDRFGNVDPTPARFGWRVKELS